MYLICTLTKISYDVNSYFSVYMVFGSVWQTSVICNISVLIRSFVA